MKRAIIARCTIAACRSERPSTSAPSPLCESLNYREWSGYYTVSAYESHHEHEYNAIRNAAALIDVSPLFKYMVTGPDAARLVDRLITRDVSKMAVGQVFYTPWCDEHGKVIDDGTVSRLGEQTFRWTAADPSLRWFRQNAGRDGRPDRGRVGGDRRARAAGADVGATAARGGQGGHRQPQILPRDQRHHRRRAVDISRTGYTGDLGYEIWMPASAPCDVFDALMEGGRAVRHQARRHAGARRRADRSRPAAHRSGFLQQPQGDDRVADVHARTSSGWAAWSARQGALHRPAGAARGARARGAARQIVGLEIDWNEVEKLYDAAGLAPAVAATASRVGDARLPQRPPGRQGDVHDVVAGAEADDRARVGRSSAYAEGTELQFEMTVEAVRHRVGAKVVKTPFFNPARKTATPPV